MSFRGLGFLVRLTRRSHISRSIVSLSGNANFRAPKNNKISQLTALSMARNYSTPVEIATYEDIKALTGKPDILLIDVREPQELIDTGVVPTSINIPLGQVVEKLSKDFPEEDFMKLYKRKKPSSQDKLIFMCKIGGRSQKALEMSRQLGYTNVKNYLGSWEDWSKQEGLSK